MAGWIKIQRDITEHWCGSDPNFFAVWFRLVAEANYKDNKTILNGTPVSIKRGQVIFGLNAFSDRSGVSVSKLRRIIKILLDESMIDRQIFNKYSIISIANYNKHQAVDRQTTSKQQANDKQTTILEEGKEGKEGKEIDIPPKKGNGHGHRIEAEFKEDWNLPEKYYAYGKSKKLTDGEIDFEFEKFVNHWKAKSGKDSSKRNWLASWRTWVLNSTKWAGNNGGYRNGQSGGGGTPLIDIATELINELDSDIP